MVVALGKEMAAFLTVAVPVVAPNVNEVAALPSVTVVAVVSNSEAVVEEVVIVPVLTAKVPSVEMSPVDPVKLNFEAVMFVAPRASPVVMEESETSRAVVMPPPPVEAILIPVATDLLVSALSIKINWDGSATPAPSALVKEVNPVEPSAVVTVKLESVVVSARVKERLRPSEVVMVLPLLYAA